MRVLQVVNGEHYAGAGRVQDLLALHLPQFNCETAFACVKPDVFPAKRQSQQVPLHEIPFRHPFHRSAVVRLAEVIDRGDFDIVHCHTPRSSWAALSAAKMTGRPVVYTMHDVFFSLGGNVGKRLQNQYSIMRLRKADFVTTVSPESMQLAEKLGLGKRRRMILNGVPSACPLIERRLPNGVWTLGFVGLIRPCKGIEVLIQAMAKLRQRGCDTRLVVVGTFESSQYEEQIRALCSTIGVADQIEFVGFSDDVPSQLRKMDLFVMPSVGPEGLPMVLLEAMAHGLPSIGSNVPGIVDTIRHGRDGLIFANRDHEQLADAVESFVKGQTDWETISQSVVARHAAEFSASRMAREFAGVYQGVLDQKTA